MYHTIVRYLWVLAFLLSLMNIPRAFKGERSAKRANALLILSTSTGMLGNLLSSQFLMAVAAVLAVCFGISLLVIHRNASSPGTEN